MTVSSDIAKRHPPEIAALASLGFITSVQAHGLTRKWRLTARGLNYLETNL